MSYPDAPNPYASPTAVSSISAASPAFKPISKIEHLRMFKYVFENPNWMMNILLGAVCSIIPVIGP